MTEKCRNWKTTRIVWLNWESLKSVENGGKLNNFFYCIKLWTPEKCGKCKKF